MMLKTEAKEKKEPQGGQNNQPALPFPIPWKCHETIKERSIRREMRWQLREWKGAWPSHRLLPVKHSRRRKTRGLKRAVEIRQTKGPRKSMARNVASETRLPTMSHRRQRKECWGETKKPNKQRKQISKRLAMF